MVCGKCQKLSKGTTLATPGVKKKAEIYHGSATVSASKTPTQGQTGIGKSKLLSKGAKNPYAQYSSSCTKCKSKISQGHSYCNKCSYQSDLCAMCGKPNKKTAGTAPTVSGQKRSLK
ncbi:unnamed protein product [Discula destructiva]